MIVVDTETLFTATKWDMLKLLEQKPLSPLEIAEQLKSSLANVSQQLRLLEMAGLVRSEKVANRDKGKPRVLYSIAGNLSYLISTSESFVEKKAMKLSERNKVVLRIWFLEDPALRYALEKAFWALESHLDTIERLTYSGIEQGIPIIEAVTKSRLPAQLDVGGQFGKVHCKIVTEPVGYVLYVRE